MDQMVTFLFVFFFTVDDPVDYQGRNFLHAPHDIGINLRSDTPPTKCFIPKKQIHVWQGHNKGVSAIRWFPKTAHLLLSCSMDSRVKVCDFNLFNFKLDSIKLLLLKLGNN